MDVKAILLIGGASGESSECMGKVPLAMLDVLGEPVVQRVISRLDRRGITAAAIISEARLEAASGLRSALRPDVKWKHANGPEFWRAAAASFNEVTTGNTELVLIMRLGAYAEIDFEEMIQFHLDRRNHVTAAVDSLGKPLDCFIATASRRNDVSSLFRGELSKLRVAAAPYVFSGYVNGLKTAQDLRTLALDAFGGQNSIRPAGREIKPGVWATEGARIHRTARILAPAFVGRGARIRASAVVTRGSSIERHAEVDCGTVVENSTLLPHTYLGAGLDLTRSVTGYGMIASLTRNVTVEISDPRLVGVGTESAAARALSAAVGLITFLPRTIVSGVLHRRAACPAETIAEAVTSTSPALTAVPEAADGKPAVPAYPPNFLTARRYGNE